MRELLFTLAKPVAPKTWIFSQIWGLTSFVHRHPNRGFSLRTLRFNLIPRSSYKRVYSPLSISPGNLFYLYVSLSLTTFASKYFHPRKSVFYFYPILQLFVIRLIRVIRGFNILSFQLQNLSTSRMPTRRFGLQQPVHRLIPSVTIRVLRFIRVLLLPMIIESIGSCKTHLAKRDLPELAFVVC